MGVCMCAAVKECYRVLENSPPSIVVVKGVRLNKCNFFAHGASVNMVCKNDGEDEGKNHLGKKLPSSLLASLLVLEYVQCICLVAKSLRDL